MLLFIGDDWAEDHHDVEIEDNTGHQLVKQGVNRPRTRPGRRRGPVARRVIRSDRGVTRYRMSARSRPADDR